MVLRLFIDMQKFTKEICGRCTTKQSGQSIYIHAVCLFVEASAFLVCHRRSGVLSEPWPLPEDETLGKVSPHLR